MKLASRPAPTQDLTLKSIRHGLDVALTFMGGGQHLGRCNADEDGPCDCGFIEPRGIIEALIEQLSSLPAGQEPSTPTKNEKISRA